MSPLTRALLQLTAMAPRGSEPRGVALLDRYDESTQTIHAHVEK